MVVPTVGACLRAFWEKLREPIASSRPGPTAWLRRRSSGCPGCRRVPGREGEPRRGPADGTGSGDRNASGDQQQGGDLLDAFQGPGFRGSPADPGTGYAIRAPSPAAVEEE